MMRAKPCPRCSSRDCVHSPPQPFLSDVLRAGYPFPEPVSFAFSPELAARLRKRIPKWTDAEPHLRWACHIFMLRNQRDRGAENRKNRNRRSDDLRERRKYEAIADDTDRLLQLARALHFKESILAECLQGVGTDAQRLVADLKNLSAMCRRIADTFKSRPGAKRDVWQRTFHDTVGVIVQEYGVKLAKSADSDYARIVGFLYEAVGIDSRPTFRTLKDAVKRIEHQKWTWCDYEFGEVRFSQSLRLNHDADFTDILHAHDF